MQISVFGKIFSSFINFIIEENKGAVAIIFAVIIIPIVALSGAMVDYSAVSNVRKEMQIAADTAALAAIKVDDDDYKELQKVAEDIFDDNIKNNIYFDNLKIKASYTKDGVRVDASSTVKTSFLRLVGLKEIKVSVFSEVVSSAALLEVALVLDTTFSMNGRKLRELKKSARKLTKTIMENVSGGSVKIGIVPFARYVNIGLSNRNEPGIDVPPDYQDGKNCWRRCQWRRTNPYPCVIDGVPSTCYKWRRYNCGGLQCQPRIYRWYGCVGSRDYPLNTTDDDYDLQKVPGLLMDRNECRVNELTRLTNNRNEVINAINNLTARDRTYIPAGLVWGWRLLSNSIPFTDASPKENAISKVLILMTDGANTISPSYPLHDRYRKKEANKITKELCENIKDDDIILYTIAFDVSNKKIKKILKKCAGNGGEYFDAEDGDELLESFEKIADNLKNLRISK